MRVKVTWDTVLGGLLRHWHYTVSRKKSFNFKKCHYRFASNFADMLTDFQNSFTHRFNKLAVDFWQSDNKLPHHTSNRHYTVSQKRSLL